MKKVPMTRKRFSSLLVACAVVMGTYASADPAAGYSKTYTIGTEKFLRFTDTKEEYGKSCEEYRYIPPYERLQLIKHKEFMLGDVLGDTLAISPVESEYLVETNLTDCSMQDINVSRYTYEESLEYLGENITTLEVFQYAYGAGAAHGNSHISYYVYDRNYGMRLEWEELFGPNEEDFDLYVLQRVVKEIASEEFISYFKANDQLLNFRLPGYFAITDEGLLIQYGKYEITPGASGLPSLLVPKKVLRKYMSEEMYRKCFMSKQQILSEVMHDF